MHDAFPPQNFQIGLQGNKESLMKHTDRN